MLDFSGSVVDSKFQIAQESRQSNWLGLGDNEMSIRILPAQAVAAGRDRHPFAYPPTRSLR